MPRLQGEHGARVCQVMEDPSVSIVQTKVAHQSPVKMKDCAQRRPASRTFTVCVPLDSKGSAASTSPHWPRPRCQPAILQTVKAKPMMVSVIKNVTHMHASGMEGTAL